MKTKNTIIAALLALMPAATFAQENIQKAFEALIKSNDVELSQQHLLEKDVETGKKRSQSDIYDFTIPKTKKALVKAIESAFDRDREQAYNVSSGTHIEIGRVLERIQELVGVRASVVVDPALVRPADASMLLDVTRLRHTCGWTPKYTFDATLRDMIEDFRARA